MGVSGARQGRAPFGDSSDRLADGQCRPGNKCVNRSSCSAAKDDDLGSDPGAVVKVSDVVVGQTNAAGGNVGTNGPGLIGAVDAVERILVAVP